MKSFLLLSFLSFAAMASNWMPLSSIKANSVQAYQLESDCKKSGEKCIDVGENPSAVSSGFYKLTPLYGGARKSVDECENKDDCETKIASKQCLESQAAFIDVKYTIVYCMDKVDEEFSIDQVKVAQASALKADQAQVNALIENGRRAREACNKVLDLIGGFNLLPGRSSEQAGQMSESFETAKNLLQDGRPGAAKVAIQAIPVDGVLVTDQMKALALDILKEY